MPDLVRFVLSGLEGAMLVIAKASSSHLEAQLNKKLVFSRACSFCGATPAVVKIRSGLKIFWVCGDHDPTDPNACYGPWTRVHLGLVHNVIKKPKVSVLQK
ncbi:MAG: hypothetical protein ABII97_01275 [Patescibacteria group bacterium]